MDGEEDFNEGEQNPYAAEEESPAQNEPVTRSAYEEAPPQDTLAEPDTRVPQPDLWTRLAPDPTGRGPQPGGGYGVPRITRGGTGPGDPVGNPRSRYTAEFAGGHRMEVIGGGTGQGPLRQIGVGGPMPPPGPGTPPLSRAEQMQLQKFQFAISDTQTKVAMGELDAVTGRKVIENLNRIAAPLIRRQAAAQIAAAQKQQQAMLQQATFEGSVENAHRTVAAMAAPNLTFELPGRKGLFTWNPRSHQMQPVPATDHERHEQKLEEIKAQAAARAQEREEHARHEQDRHYRDYLSKVYESAHRRVDARISDEDRKKGVTPNPLLVEEEAHRELRAHERMRGGQPVPGQQPGGPIVTVPNDPAKRRDYFKSLTSQYPDPSVAPTWVRETLRQHFYGH
jgi:hypothetical protein